MRKLLIFCLFIVSVNGLSQLDSQFTLFSKGETPAFLNPYESRYFIPEKEPWIRGIKKDQKSFYFDIIYSSNTILYGDEVSKYCSELLSEYAQSSKQVYAVRSDKVATFSDDQNIFVTTGLISRLSNEAQLMFFLVRELEVFKSGQLQSFGKVDRKRSVDYAIQELSSFELEFNKKLDKKAFQKVSAQALYSENEIKKALDVLKFQNRPFYETPFDITYFNSEKSYVPESEYFLLRKPKPKLYDYKTEFPTLEKRIESFNIDNTPVATKTFVISEEDFLNIVTSCRYESVRLNILHAKFTTAIYEIYTLEKLGFSSKRLNLLKATAWWGLVNQSVGNILPKKYSSYQSSDSEGALFMLYLNTKSKLSKISIAFRILQDERLKNPKSQSLQRMFDDLIRIASNMEEFELENFHDKGLKETINSFNKELGGEDNALLDVESQALSSKGIDSINYYYFLIPDLVKDEKFVNRYKAYKKGRVDQENHQPNSVAIVDFNIRKYKRKKVAQVDNKAQIISKSFETTNKKSDVQVVNKEFSSELNYNLSYLTNSIIIQNYWYNDYKEPVNSVFSDDLVSLAGNIREDAFGSFIYEHSYEPRYRPFHLVGLAVLTLPYIIPEIFFSGNRTIVSSVILNSTTGETIQLTNDRYRDPYNSLMIRQSFLEEITNLTND